MIVFFSFALERKLVGARRSSRAKSSRRINNQRFAPRPFVLDKPSASQSATQHQSPPAARRRGFSVTAYDPGVKRSSRCSRPRSCSRS